MNQPTHQHEAPYRQGLHIVKTAWIEACLAQSGEQFEQQYFSIAERHRTQIRAPYAQYLAGRFAAKATILQILHIQLETFDRWHDIEIKNWPHGEPFVTLDGYCQKLAADLHLNNWLLSISHISTYAAASVIARLKSPFHKEKSPFR
ncbi:holo-ACP synthase [Acaryochloris marina]|uniref:Probable holo-(Acyl-carrier-protein) synthase n=1 Tax=Acaryochloris marina (strain MBIC 11017) TaxID=329726 RepID=A8ZKQ0_ACAM1|nr:4'-phosphopantetheinyl transferase superfamily protein [Acaryochloris marina]ABW31368.1 probable holo-(acyl-carrier-protein) synthase [Acaryochloris marina MBIC11017]